jgi:hypothetical protein
MHSNLSSEVNMKLILPLLLLSTIIGCTSTTSGPIPAGNNTYVVSRQAGMFPSGKEPLLEESLALANGMCASMKKTMKIVTITENMQPIGNFPKATVVFSCE